MKRKIIQYLLWVLAKLTLWRYHPLIIAVSGSTGKSSTKEAIYYALKNNFRVKRSTSNLNTEIGVPLTIIQGYDAKTNVFLWLANIFKTFGFLIFKQKDYPEILILEMSEDRPGLIDYLTNLCQPKIGVISWISDLPVHAEFYPNAQTLHQEIQKLVLKLPKDGTAILNCDNDLSLEIKDKIKSRLITYGFTEKAEVNISDYSLVVSQDLRDTGMSFRLEYQGSYVPLKFKGVFGEAQAYALAAGAAAGLALGLNLVQIAQSLEEYKILKARTTFLKGKKNTWILDDSYNSNPTALRMALKIFSEVAEALKREKLYSLQRRILALGEMRELGKYSEEAHRQIASQIIKEADLLILVGEKMKITYAECLKLGFPKENIFWFENSQEAALKAQELLREGDLILVKGSRGIHLEEVSLALMANAEEAEKYLEFGCPT